MDFSRQPIVLQTCMTYRLIQLILLVILKWLADRNSAWNSDRRAKTKVFVQKMWKMMEKKIAFTIRYSQVVSLPSTDRT